MLRGGEAGWTETSTIAWFAAAAVFLTGWVMWELRTPNALLDPRLFRRIPFGLGSLTIVAAFAVMFGMFFILVVFITGCGGGVFTVTAAMAAFMVDLAGAAFGSPPVFDVIYQ